MIILKLFLAVFIIVVLVRIIMDEEEGN